METMSLIREIYREGFRDLGHSFFTYYFKAFFWFSFSMFLIALYAFIFRLVTGFAFN